MVRLKNPGGIRFLLLFALLPCVFSGIPVEFDRYLEKTGLLSSSSPEGQPAESGGALFISGALLSYGQPVNQTRTRLWRQSLPLAVPAPPAKAFSGAALWKYGLRRYFPLFFIHILVISLLLGGRAPPRSVSPIFF
jgi:hypothetical protein